MLLAQWINASIPDGKGQTSTGLRAHTHTPFFFFLLCVLFMCFYVFSLVITRALPEPQGTGKEDKHGLMWSNFPPSENKERENKRKRKPKKIETTRKWDAKCDCLLNHIQKWFKVTIFPLLCFIHGGLLSPMSFTQPQWGIIGWGIGLWDTVLCNHRDLSPFYKLLSFCNSCL